MNDPKDNEEQSVDIAADPSDVNGVALSAASEVREASVMDVIEVVTYLNHLKEQTNEVLAEAETEAAENESLFGEPVNWAGLGCEHTEVWRDNDGEAGSRVYIIGSSAGAKKFHAWVADRLATRDLADIQVVAAW